MYNVAIKIAQSFLSKNTSFGCVRFHFSRSASFAAFENMLKNKIDERELGRIKAKKQKCSEERPVVPPNEIYLCVLGNGAVGSPRALYMFTDRGRYLFNCGEGTQRLAHEHKMKLSKLCDIFITHKSWENLGGLLGLSLTVQDIGTSKINLHCPPGVGKLYDMASSFLFCKNVSIENKDCTADTFSDGCIEVQYIPIKSENQSPLSTSDSECELEETEDVKKYPETTLAYACKGHSKPGQLLYEKCVEQGVPPGPLLGELKNGKDVTLPSGKVVYSKDVVSETQHCPVFLVVECPSEQFLDPFVNEKKFEFYQEASISASSIPALIVHFTPPSVLHHPKYQEWIKRFPKKTCHLVLNSDNSTLNSFAIHRIQYKLNLLHPKMFSLLNERETLVKNTSGMIQADALINYHLRPFKELDGSNAIVIEPSLYLEEANNVKGFNEALKLLQGSVRLKEQECAMDTKSPEVVFLGTGSCIPSKVRNVSGILLKLCDENYIIMDCGEGTYGQLVHLYGCVAVDQILKNLCCIFISHMHADHHLGLIQILRSRGSALREANLENFPLVTVGPWKLKSWLKGYHKLFQQLEYEFIGCSSLKYSNKTLTENDEIILTKCIEGIDVSTVPVNHCPDAHGLVLSHNSEKWKIVYSGDTTPCEALIDAGKDCTLLIHEATMEDDLHFEASMKKHSTTSDAVEIARKMNAEYTILTHFSQRYAKVPLFSEQFHNRIGCAFDNMKVSLHELPILPEFIPALKCLFAENVGELEAKGVKRREKQKIIETSLSQNILNAIR